LARNGHSMRAGECLFLGEKRACSGHRQKTGTDPERTSRDALNQPRLNRYDVLS